MIFSCHFSVSCIRDLTILFLILFTHAFSSFLYQSYQTLKDIISLCIATQCAFLDFLDRILLSLSCTEPSHTGWPLHCHLEARSHCWMNVLMDHTLCPLIVSCIFSTLFSFFLTSFPQPWACTSQVKKCS